MDNAVSLIISTLRSLNPRPGPESVLAEDVAAALRSAGLDVQRERELTRGRVDLCLGSVVIELKVQGTADAVLRQLQRYAHDPTVSTLVLVTTSAKHRAMPATLGPKPLHVIYLPRL
jgi:hypothetical protein